MTRPTGVDLEERLGRLSAMVTMLRHMLGGWTPEDVADLLALAGVRVGYASAERLAELRACAARLPGQWTANLFPPGAPGALDAPPPRPRSPRTPRTPADRPVLTLVRGGRA
jgi:hypothetical protein